MSEIIPVVNEYSYSIDKKNRLFIPSKIREAMGESIIIAPDLRREALVIYTLDEWNANNAKIEKLPAEKREMLFHIYNSKSDVYIPDAQGRITLNQKHVDYAHLDGPVMIEGLGRKARIWNADIYKNTFTPEVEKAAMIDLANEADIF